MFYVTILTQKYSRFETSIYIYICQIGVRVKYTRRFSIRVIVQKNVLFDETFYVIIRRVRITITVSFLTLPIHDHYFNTRKIERTVER